MYRKKYNLRPLKVTNKVESKKGKPYGTPRNDMDAMETPPPTPGVRNEVNAEHFGIEGTSTASECLLLPGVSRVDGDTDFLKEAEVLIEENIEKGISLISKKMHSGIGETQQNTPRNRNLSGVILLTPTSPTPKSGGIFRTKAAMKALPENKDEDRPKEGSQNPADAEEEIESPPFEIHGQVPIDLTKPLTRMMVLEHQAKRQPKVALNAVGLTQRSAPEDVDEAPNAQSDGAEEPLNLELIVQIEKTQRFNIRWVNQVLPLDEKYNVIKCHGEQGKVRDAYFPTRWIPYDSPYCDRERSFLGPDTSIKRHQGFNIHDRVNISVFKFNDGEIRACRLYQNVTIKKRQDKFVEARQYNHIHREIPHRISPHSVMPTQLIPFNSPYFAEIAEDLYFPVAGHVWVCKKGRDDVQVNFRLGEKGRSLFIYRNGIVIQAYPYPKI